MPDNPPARWPPPCSGTWLLDLDGVVWLAGRAIPGGAEAVERLRAAGAHLLFVTNNSSPTSAQLVERLAAVGIPVGPGDLVTSARAAASMVGPGERVLVVGDAGIHEALADRQAEVVETGGADAGHGIDTVVVGWTRQFDFERLDAAATAVRRGARLIGTNEDPTYPTPDGQVPGAGALLAAVAVASGREPVVTGKPHSTMVGLLRDGWPDLSAVVGDRPSTDGALARRLGVPFGLVTSGVTSPDGPIGDPAPDATAADLRELVRDLLDAC